MSADDPGPGPRRPVRVLHLIGSLDVGGAERVALDLCRVVPRERVQQTFLCLSGRKGALAEDFEASGAVVVPLGIRPAHTLLQRFSTAVRTARPDSFVSHVSLASGPFLVVARALRVPQRIARLHNNADDHGNGLGRRLYRVLMRACVFAGATHVLGVTQAAALFGLGRWTGLAGRSKVVGSLPNGVDAHRFSPSDRPLEPGRIVMVHIGRVGAQKNRGALVGILDAVSARRPATLRVVGTLDTSDLGPGATRLEIVGPAHDVRPVLQAAHVLVLPSRWEGLPGVVLEALACGVPVVASDLPGTREIARSCAGVSLVPVDAPPEAWADAVITAAETGARLKATIRGTFLRSPFTLDQSVRSWRLIWCEAASDVDSAQV